MVVLVDGWGSRILIKSITCQQGVRKAKLFRRAFPNLAFKREDFAKKVLSTWIKVTSDQYLDVDKGYWQVGSNSWLFAQSQYYPVFRGVSLSEGQGILNFRVQRP